LVAAGVVASDGRLDVFAVCLIGIIATVIGANVGYVVGHRFGPRALSAPGPFFSHRRRLLATGGTVVHTSGWIAVLISRFVPGLRESASILAGVFRMAWPRFFLWNTLGGVAWVLYHVLLGYYVGRAAGLFQGSLILVAIKVAGLLTTVAVVYVRRRRRQQSPPR
jgi:membrane-associated protein